jgi:hypothetical protein
MQFMLLIYENEKVYGEAKDNAVLMEIVGKHRAFAASLGTKMQGGSGLKGTDTATTVRTKDASAKTVHDGPFAETKEQLGGYYIVDVPDLDAAIALAKQIPIYKDGCVEIRPMMTGPMM